MSLKSATEKLAKEWKDADELFKEELLRVIVVCHRELSGIVGLIPNNLMKAATDVILAALPKLLLGKSVEQLAIEALSAVPELSPYVRQLFTDKA